MEKEIEYYETEDGKCPYIEWLESLDNSVQIRVLKRVDKLKNGLYGDRKQLQNSNLSELRLNFGKGYRIYYYDTNGKIIIFFTGSDKKEQKETIKKANTYFEDYKKGTKQ